MNKLSRKSKHLLEEKGMSLRDSAKAARISRSFIADIESGRSSSSLDTLTSIAEALGVSASESPDPSTASGSVEILPLPMLS